VAIKFNIGLGRSGENFRWDVVVFKNHRQQRRGELYRLKLGNFRGNSKGQSKACVIAYKPQKNTQWLGCVLFSEDFLRDETLLHESIHMAWSIADYLRKYDNKSRWLKRDFEEMLCLVSGLIFKELKRKIKRELGRRRGNNRRKCS
jgi:hypothetical protein